MAEGQNVQPVVAFATHNAHKIDEVYEILKQRVPGLERGHLLSAAEAEAPAPVECGISYQENALIKARALAERTGLPAIADDSGLSVDVMGGAPGIFSALWSGRHGDDKANLDLLLAQMEDIPDANRQAAFVCAAVLVHPDGREITEMGIMGGRLTREPSGAAGFGYDPIFVASGQCVTNAELDPEVKNAISHRGGAFRALAPHVAALLPR